MKLTTILSAIVEAGLWYACIYYLLYAIKHETNLFVSALILLVLAYSACMMCPWFRNTQAWAKLWQD